MELLLITALALFVIVATVRSVIRDGRGETPPERSHADWTAGSVPSRPYSEVTRLA
ncbi:hypothetical protein ACMX2H_00890 [Arthrobacter sulfonylureivorans]|uniref:hypothetical protein n=1 Tax=Arthrobacter sulfonylureivorans TaxID=2486855 RepID=UPI0039E41E52